jgi:hypothetical protein
LLAANIEQDAHFPWKWMAGPVLNMLIKHFHNVDENGNRLGDLPNLVVPRG